MTDFTTGDYMNQDLISIIVPIYNVESYVEQCIASLTAQSYERIEIILVDDGSTDSCPEICDGWAEKDSRITVIHKQNGGLSDARNTGIEVARGDFLMFIDGDDYVFPTMCKSMLQTACEFQADIVVSNFVYIYPDGTRKYYRSEMPKQCVCYTGKGAFIEYFKTFRLDFMIAPNKLYRRTLFFDGDRIRFPLGRLGEDAHTSYRILYAANCVAVISEAFYCYVQRPGSIMDRYDAKFVQDTIACAEQYLLWGADKPSDVQLLLQRGCLYHYFSLKRKINILGILQESDRYMRGFEVFLKKNINSVWQNPYLGKNMRIKYMIHRMGLYPLFLLFMQGFAPLRKIFTR